jgi:hypothetical protein
VTHKHFTHKDALRQEIPLSTPPTPEAVEKVRKLAASQSEDVSEFSMFLDMLGIPLQEEN